MLFIKPKIVYYQTKSGRSPFYEWLRKLDEKTKERINERLFRLTSGNFGDHKNIGDGIFELRFHFDSGYRIYFGKENNKIIILLNAGNKSSQSRDIKQAKEFWEDFKNA